MPSAKRAITLLSGGLDSTAATLFAVKQGFNIELALTFDYGQRANQREQEKAQAISAHLRVPHRTLQIPFFADLSETGALLRGQQTIPTPALADLDNLAAASASAAAVWVPNRNGLFIEIAATIAEDRDCDTVIVGFNQEEAKTFPDNSAAYLAAINQALRFSTSNQVQVVSPTLAMNKLEILSKLLAEGFPLHLLWSCYLGQELMCGRCESCLRFKRAAAGVGTPVEALFANPIN